MESFDDFFKKMEEAEQQDTREFFDRINKPRKPKKDLKAVSEELMERYKDTLKKLAD